MSSQPGPSARQGVQLGIPGALMRGGTSRRLYFQRADLPDNRHARDKVLLAAMGSPDPRQIDGAGGANPLTSKVAIVGPSATNGVDVDYLFAQVHTDQALVDLNPTCGNLLAGVGPFAIERGMVEAADGETRVRIHMVNTGGLVETVVQTPGRLEICLGILRVADGIEVVSAGLVRTARLIFDGGIYVPGSTLEPGSVGDHPRADATT